MTRRARLAVLLALVASVPGARALAEPGCAGVAIAPSDVTPVAIAGGYGFGTPQLDGTVAGARALAVDPLGKLLVADAGNHRVLRINPATGFILATITGGPGTLLRSPSGVAVTEQGVIYVADTGNDRIAMFSLAGIPLGSFGATGSTPGSYRTPRGLAVLADGTLAIADQGNDRVQIVSGSGTAISILDGLSGPAGVAAHGGSLFVADTRNHRVVRYDASGARVGSWGGPGSAPGCLNGPEGIAADAFGVFVADTAANRVVHFSRQGAPIESWGSSGTAPGRLQVPVGVLADRGTIWVGEERRLQTFRPRARVAPIP